MSRRRNLVGCKFGRWTVVEFAFVRSNYRAFWKCLCECGNEGIVRGEHLRIGKSQSCGCYHKELVTTNNGITKHPLYNIWRNMIKRCTDPSEPAFSDYGARGITIDSSWFSFQTFCDDMGDRPSTSHTLDRIDNNLGYSKVNCKWSTWSEQAINRRPVRSLSNYSTDELLEELKRRGIHEHLRSKTP